MSSPRRFSPSLYRNSRVGPKEAVQNYFTRSSFVGELVQLWGKSAGVAAQDPFSQWHHQRVMELGTFLKQNGHVRDGYKGRAAARKLLGTFMHKLLKYQNVRYLWRFLYLPFAQQVFKALRRRRQESAEYSAFNKSTMCVVLKRNPYKVDHRDYAPYPACSPGNR